MADALERFKQEQNRVTDESLESTRRMVQMVEESQDAGTKTIEMLETARGVKVVRKC